MPSNMKAKMRVLRCKRCGNLVQTDVKWSIDRINDRFEDRCADPKAPGGYWYCKYEELVPKKKTAKAKAQVKNVQKI